VKSYEEFRKAIGQRESSDNYACKNQFGFLGRYQFGMARLCDLGLTHRKDPESHSCENDAFEWNDPLSEQNYLEHPKLQDHTFDLHVADLKRQLRRFYHDDNWSGAIAASHLVGVNDYRKYYETGEKVADANGVTAADYEREFTGYEIP